MNKHVSIIMCVYIHIYICIEDICKLLKRLSPSSKKLVLPGHVLVPVRLLVVACSREPRAAKRAAQESPSSRRRLSARACALHLLCKDGAFRRMRATTVGGFFVATLSHALQAHSYSLTPLWRLQLGLAGDAGFALAPRSPTPHHCHHLRMQL